MHGPGESDGSWAHPATAASEPTETQAGSDGLWTLFWQVLLVEIFSPSPGP